MRRRLGKAAFDHVLTCVHPFLLTGGEDRGRVQISPGPDPRRYGPSWL